MTKRRRTEPPLEAALAALRAGLDAAGSPWMIVGGLAVVARGVRRFTSDIDATVRGDVVTINVLVECLELVGITPRIPDAAAFASQNLVLLMKHQPTGVQVDVSLAWTRFEHEALAAATEVAFGRLTVPMPTVAALVVYKAIAARPKDLEDAEALLVLYPDVDLGSVRRLVAELAEGADLPELVEGLDRVVARARR